jgi:hypothetical protein
MDAVERLVGVESNLFQKLPRIVRFREFFQVVRHDVVRGVAVGFLLQPKSKPGGPFRSAGLHSRQNNLAICQTRCPG